MDKISMSIDGVNIFANKGQTVLEAALEAGIYIPHICSHPDLEAQGGCKLCVIEVNNDEQPVLSCKTIVQEEMQIITKTEKLNKLRSISMELMLAGHPHDCTSCKAYMNCELQAMMQYLGVVHARMHDIHKENTKINVVNPLIIREMERCIQCGRCVRACKDLRGIGTIDYKQKNSETYIGTENDLPFVDTNCRFCGACIEVCPTGALQDAIGTFRTDIPKEDAMVPCTTECPANIDIPAYVRFVNEDKCSEAVGVIREKVPFPHALGYVCNHRCETGCKREKLNEAISIRDLKRYAVEHDKEQSWKNRGFKNPDTNKTVAIIGAGPTGMTSALYLRKLGHEVTVYERLPIAGGMMTTGMPEYRIPREDVQKEIDFILETGVKLKTNYNIESVSKLKEEGFDAVLVAIGASKGKKLNYLPGADFNNVYTAVDFLRASRLGTPLDLGKSVTIIGGGNVSFDCARTLIRMGLSVNVVCLEKRQAMLADKQEIEEGLEEGVELYDSYTNISIEGSKNKLTGLKVQKVEKFCFDENGKMICDIIPSSEEIIITDSIIFATGQITDLTDIFGLELNKFGFPICDKESLITSIPGVFAAGDVITGTKFLIDAIVAGRKAASIIDQYLGGTGVIEETLVERSIKHNIGVKDQFANIHRQEVQILEPEKRKNSFEIVDLNYSPPQAVCESGRCLQCDLRVSIGKVSNWNAYNKN